MQFLYVLWHFYILLWAGNPAGAFFLHGIFGLAIFGAVHEHRMRKQEDTHEHEYCWCRSERKYALSSGKLEALKCVHSGCDVWFTEEMLHDDH